MLKRFNPLKWFVRQAQAPMLYSPLEGFTQSEGQAFGATQNNDMSRSPQGASTAFQVSDIIFRSVTYRAQQVASTRWEIIDNQTGEVVADKDNPNNDPLAMVIKHAWDWQS